MQYFHPQETKIELLHVAVNSRKNDFITRVLDKLCQPLPEQTDETDGRDVDVVPRSSHMLDRAIFFATLNDDPESLEEILEWRDNNNFPTSGERCVGSYSPILYACLKDYTRCISILYSYKYRVSLPEEEAKIIKQILATNDAVENEYNFYTTLYSGDRHVNQFDSLIRRKSQKKKTQSKTDPVERLLSIKAYANPHYITTELMWHHEHNAIEEKNFCQYDPVRKSLALARYTKFLSNFYVQYSQEYLEISKVIYLQPLAVTWTMINYKLTYLLKWTKLKY